MFPAAAGRKAEVEFFDINMRAGAGALGTYRPASNAPELKAEMDRLGVRKALVWHIAQQEFSAVEGNCLVNRIASGDRKRLLGSWALLPPQTGEQGVPGNFFGSMKKHGARALRMFPADHRFLLNRAVFGRFLDEVADRKIPVLFSIAGRGVAWEQIYGLLEDYPGLVCVLCDTGIWGSDRYFRPLLERYENVFVETSLISLGEGVMESLVGRYGPGRLLFGTGFPVRIPGAAILQLIHADIPNRDKSAIAMENAENLMSEVAL